MRYGNKKAPPLCGRALYLHITVSMLTTGKQAVVPGAGIEPARLAAGDFEGEDQD